MPEMDSLPPLTPIPTFVKVYEGFGLSTMAVPWWPDPPRRATRPPNNVGAVGMGGLMGLAATLVRGSLPSEHGWRGRLPVRPLTLRLTRRSLARLSLAALVSAGSYRISSIRVLAELDVGTRS